MLNVRVSIASLEAFNVVVALRLWGPEWSGEKVFNILRQLGHCVCGEFRGSHRPFDPCHH